MIVYKLPAGINLSGLRALKGSDGSSMNPIEDADGNWVLTAEEIHSKEFNDFKILYIDFIVQFEMIEYKPKLITPNI